MTESLGSAVLELDADAGPLSKALDVADTAVMGKISGLAASVKSVFGAGLGGAAKAGFAGLVIGAGAAGKALYDLGAQFDEAYDTIQQTTGATGQELEGLKDDFRAVVSDIPTDFKTASTAIAELNQRLGLTGQPLQDVAKQVIELSRMTGTDLSDNITSVTRLFGDWGVETEDQSATLDKFWRLSQETGIKVGDLANSLVQFGSPLRQLGFDLDTSAAMFAKFEKEGVNTQTLMPGLKLALANLSAPTDDLAKTMEKLGISMDDPKQGLMDTMEAIKNAGSTAEANQIAFAVFGKRAGPDMSAAIREGRFELDELLDSMKNGDSTIMGTAAETNDLSENWQIFKNKVLIGLEPLATAVFEAVNKGLEFLLKAMEDLGERGPAAIADVKQALKPLLIVMGVVWDATKEALGGMVDAFKGGFKMIGGIVEVFSALFSGDWGKLWDGVKKILEGAWEGIKGILTAMTAPIRDLAQHAWDAVKDIVSGAWDKIKQFVTDGVDRIKTIMSGGWDAIKGAADAVWDRMKSIVEGAWDRIKDIVSGAVDRVKTVLSGAWDAIKSVAEGAWDRVKDVIINPISSAIDRLRDFMGSIKDALSSAWEAVKNAASAAWERVKDLIIQPIQGAIEFLTGIPGKMFDLGKKIMQGLWDGIKSLVDGIKSTISDTVDWITGKVNLLNNKVDEAFEAVKDVAQAVQDANNKANEMPSPPSGGGGNGGGGKNGKVGDALGKMAATLAPVLPGVPAVAGAPNLAKAIRDHPGSTGSLDQREMSRLAAALEDLNKSGTRGVVDALVDTVSERQGYGMRGRRRTAGDGRLTR